MLTRRIINKLLHPTITGIKRPAHDSSELNSRIQLVRDLFDLEASMRAAGEKANTPDPRNDRIEQQDDQ
jgi:outer membrane murein-binding lipoprotein Lpp